jgi:phage anti-repressor protein
MLNLFKSPKKLVVEHHTSIVNLNDPLIRKIQSTLDIQEQEMFIQSFYGYLNHDDENDFIVDLDDIYQWIGYSSKQKAKDLLVKEFHENIDYKIALNQMGKRKNDGGFNKITYLMNVATFEGFCMAAHTEKGKQTRRYFRKMANIIKEHIKNQLQIQSDQLKQKELEYQKQLEAKEQELLKYKEKTYEEIEKTGHIYVIKTDGGTKVGKTKDCVSKRIKGLQTANVNDIEVLLDFPTSNADLLEKCAHYILDRYRCNSNREFFDCDVNYINTVVIVCGTVIDTLKSSYQHISNDELKDKLKCKGVEVHCEESIKVHNEEPPVCHQNTEFNNWLSENIEYCENEVMKLKDVVETFLGRAVKNECEKSKYKKDVELFVKRKYEHIKHEYGKVRDNQNTTYGWKHLALTHASPENII